MNEIRERPCEPHEQINVSQKNLETAIALVDKETDCFKYAQICHLCQIYAD